MKFPLFFASLLGPAFLVAAEPAALWRLDRADNVGGHPTEMLGAPLVAGGADGPALQFNGASDGLFVPLNPLEG